MKGAPKNLRRILEAVRTTHTCKERDRAPLAIGDNRDVGPHGRPGAWKPHTPPMPTSSGRALLAEVHVTQDIWIWRLRNKRRALEQKLREQLKRPLPDTLVVQELKRQKLRLKDQIALAEATAMGTA